MKTRKPPCGASKSGPVTACVAFALFLPLLAAAAAAQEVEAPPEGGPPGWVLVDDMWLPPGDAVVTGTPWPNHTLWYTFDGAVTTEQRRLFRKALSEVSAIANLNCTEGTGSGNYVYVRPNPSSNNVSNSSVGMVGGPQNLNVGSNHWDLKYILAHEVFHALGYKHEQSRLDRDQYVTINWFYISNTACSGNPCSGNFQIDPGAIPVTPYDFLSIMHYNDTSFTIVEGVPTIIAKPGYEQFQDRMGNRNYFTTHDASGLAFRYGAALAPTMTGISPNFATEDTGPLLLTIDGTKFFEGSLTGEGVTGTVITWNGTALETTWVDSTTVTAVVPASLVDTPGAASVNIRNHAAAGGTGASPYSFTILPAPCGSTLDKKGFSVCGLGDVNSDGIPDYAVGIPGADYGNNTQAGKVLVVSGATGNTIHTHVATLPSGESGTVVAALGDQSGDGRMELMIGIPGESTDTGHVRIVNAATGAAFADIYGSATTDRFGASLADIGDIDGDGDREFLVGIPGWGNNQGRVEVWSWNGGMIRAHNGAAALDSFGTSVGGGVDVSGDGVPDYVVGAPGYDGAAGTNTGRITVYSGATGGLLTSKTGDFGGDNLGQSVTLVPSTTAQSGNGHIVAGAPFGNAVGTDYGYVRVYRGNGTFNPYDTVTTIGGSAAGDRFGWFVATAGDPDDDGRCDLLIGATQAGTNSTGGGRVVIWSVARDEQLYRDGPSNFLGPTEVDSRFGYSAALLGDINGDARLDYVVGQPYADEACTNSGDIDIILPPIPPVFGRVLISEVSAAEPDCVELTNFGTAAVSLSGWRVRWKDGSTYTSSALSFSLQPGESAIIKEAGGTLAEAPAGTQIFSVLPTIPTNTSAFAVALVNESGFVVDEVHVAGSNGEYNEGSLGGKFRGYVRNLQTGQFVGPIHAERAWGLDSNGGSDWSSHGRRSMGLENSWSGLAGIDPIAVAPVVLNEIDDSPDLVELRNFSTQAVDMRNWSILASAGQNLAHVHVRPPFGVSGFYVVLGGSDYLVLGEGSTRPAETPTSVIYLDVTANGGTGFPWTTSKYDAVLFDSYGRLVDYVRSTGHDDIVAHNHPRAPSRWSDFIGAAKRNPSGSGAIARRGAFDWNRGSDFAPVTTRTMGTANPLIFSLASPFAPLDVRLHAVPGGGGLTMIINAGSAHEGEIWSFGFSYGHLNGTGPILGLGGEALSIYQLLSTTPPYFGTLDYRGAARLDFPAATIPPGIDLDTIFLLQDPVSLQYTAISFVLEFDS